MNTDDLRLLETIGVEAKVAAGLLLIERGQHGAGLYVVLEGTVLVEAPEGTRDLGPGAIIGERALLSADGLRTARVRANSDVRVLAIDRTAFERLCAADPAFARRLTEDLGQTGDQLADHAAS
jgi:CRP-like cAMP-binding protein